MHFSLGTFYRLILKLTNSFLGHTKSTDDTIEDTLQVCYSVFIFWHFFLIFFLRLALSLPISQIWFCMLSTFLFKVLNILIITILNSLSDNANTCVISESGSYACFVSSHYIFFLPFGTFSNFLLKASHIVLYIRKCIKRPPL